MDDSYVPNLSFHPSITLNVKDENITNDIDIHLMVKNQEKWVNQCILYNPTSIIIHHQQEQDLYLLKRSEATV